MIVVVGQPVLRNLGDRVVAAGSAARIATAAAAGGSSVQLVGKVGEDPDGDVLVLALAAAGVGHVALLRDPSRRTPRLVSSAREVGETGETEEAGEGAFDEALDGEPEPARIEPTDAADRPALDPGDIDLGLRYLTEFSVLVVAVPVDDAVASIVSAAAGWASAALIVLVDEGATPTTGLPPDAIVLQAPPPDPDGPFDILVGDLAASIDRGVPAGDAFRDLLVAAGWEPAEA